MSALEAIPLGPEEARQRAGRLRVQSYFATRHPPPPKPAEAPRLSPFHPARLAAERERRESAWDGPPAVIYDFGPGHIGVMIGAKRHKHANLTLTKECEEIADEVSRKHKVPVGDITSARRDRATSAARQELFWRCRHETSSTIPAIGRLFNRDHTTVLYGIEQHQKRVDRGETK